MTNSQSKYELTIVMPFRNEEKFLSQTLDQIYLQNFPMDRLEIVISEGDSTDSTRKIAGVFKNRFGSLKVLDNPKKLSSSGKNVGIKNSTAAYILILDNRAYFPYKNFLRDIVEIFQRTNADCICYTQSLESYDLNEFEMAVAICRASNLGHEPGLGIEPGYEGEVDPTYSGAMYTRHVFDKVGYFDEEFDAADNIDFNYRVKLFGLKSYHSPDLKLFYYPPAHISGLWRQMYQYGTGCCKFSCKHKRFSPIQWLAGAGVLSFGLMFFLSLLSNPILEVFRTLTGFYLLIVLAFSLFLAVKEKHLECLLYGPIIFLTIHFGYGLGFIKEMFERIKKKSLII